MKIRQQLVTKNKQTHGGVNPLLGVVVHETGNTSRGANAAAHANLQTNGNSRDASWHITVDEKEAVQSYPDTAQCWHAGNREANTTRLAVEICVNEDGDYDAAFRNAAEVVRMKRIEHGWSRNNVEQHFDHSGKDCPARIRAEGRWEEFLNLTEPEGETVTQFSSPLPVGTYRTDSFDGLHGGRQHMGTDWAGPHVGDMTEVYAVADGTIEHIGGPGRGAVLPGHSGLIIVIDHGILKDANGSDRIRTNYGHLSKIYVREGQRVKAGQVIGRTGRTGNVTGVHLHMGVRENGTGYGNYFDPEAWLKRKGITVGKTPPLNAGGSAPAEVKPAGKPAPAKKVNSKADNEAIQKALTNMGLDVGYPDGVDGPKQKAGVRAFQKHHGLVQDEYWGPLTQDVYEYNKRLQRALNKMKSTTPKLKVDGWLGAPTNRRKADVLKRNKWTNANLISNLKKVQAW